MSDAATQEEIRALAQQIADMAARSDVECYCDFTDQFSNGQRWYVTTSSSPDESEWVRIAVRYLTLRNRINVHPANPNLVNFDNQP